MINVVEEDVMLCSRHGEISVCVGNCSWCSSRLPLGEPVLIFFGPGMSAQASHALNDGDVGQQVHEPPVRHLTDADQLADPERTRNHRLGSDALLARRPRRFVPSGSYGGTRYGTDGGVPGAHCSAKSRLILVRRSSSARMK